MKFLNDNEIKILINNALSNKILHLKCYYCDSKVRKRIETDYSVICTWKACKKSFSMLKDTVFYRTNIELFIMVKTICLFFNNYNIKQISELTEISKISIRNLLIKVNKYLQKYINDNLGKIGGDNVICEVDESKFGKRKYNRGKKVTGSWVIGIVERTDKKSIRLKRIDKRDMNNIDDIIKKFVKQKTIIYSDEWRGYNNLINIEYDHFTVNHSKHYKDPITGVHTNTIEGNWSAIKRTIPFKYRNEKYIDIFLNKFMLKREYGDDTLKILINFLLK